MSPTAIVAYLALFALAGFSFLFINLLVGKFVRPDAPNTEKLEVYECGEPTIGSSFVQFDLRFYVVALLFIIFDVEVAFFFPWATVFGKATHLMDPNFEPVQVAAAAPDATPPALSTVELAPAAARVLHDLGVPQPTVPLPEAETSANTTAIRNAAKQLALTSVFDILVFFAVLMVGFAYVWKRGDLDWVRAISKPEAEAPPLRIAELEEPEPALVH
jgi:NADH-quinone oxidoreductase subunit A